MRRVLFLIAILMMVPTAAAAGGGGGSISLCPAYSAGTTISLLDSCFNGIAHSTPVGETLTVSNDGGLPHTLTAVDGSFDTGQLSAGQSAKLSIESTGIYKVYCTLHGSVDGSGMAGLIIVGEPDPAFAAPPLDPAQIKADVSDAVAEGNQTLAATVDGHEMLLTALVTGQTDLSQKVDRLADNIPSETSAPIVVSVPEAEGLGLLALLTGLAAGLALAALVAALIGRRSRPVMPAADFRPVEEKLA